jgi:NADH:ubiquinone oxidoreductase subunit 4 (subunit M)
MFYLVDCVQRRYNTRVVSEISGILHTTPNLGIAILFMQVLYSGLPGTLKFLSEFYIFFGLLNCLPFTTIVVMYAANFLGLIGFSKCWFNIVFGLTLKNQDKLPVDLTYKELLIIFICVGSMFFFGFGFNMIL